MFSGIVETVGIVESLSSLRADGSHVLSLRSRIFADDAIAGRAIRVGDSVSVSGVCLTAVSISDGRAGFDLASETLRCTTLGSWKTGREVNLERSLCFGDSVDGHFVQGHVDAVSEVLKAEREGNTLRLLLTLPPVIRALIVPKGSVAVDGVSLTVGEVSRESFSVYIIPHTAQSTTLHSAQPGALMNLEADCMARYLYGLAEPYLKALKEAQ